MKTLQHSFCLLPNPVHDNFNESNPIFITVTNQHINLMMFLIFLAEIDLLIRKGL